MGISSREISIVSINILGKFQEKNPKWTRYHQFTGHLQKSGLGVPVHSQEFHEERNTLFEVFG